MRRRGFLGSAGLAGASLLGSGAGCLSLGRRGARRSLPPALEDPPDVVYRPTHVGGMALVGTASAGPFRFGLLYSYPDRFWEVVGRTAYRRSVEESDDVHLMATVWDPETGIVLPEVGLTVEVRRDGDLVTEEAVYAMLSQRLGFHYGDNFALSGDGTYAVSVRVGGVQIRRTGEFEGRFDDPASVEIPFEYAERDRNTLARRVLEDAGSPGAIEPTSVPEVPNAVASTPEELPGRHLGSVRSGDARFDVLVLEGTEAARFDAEPYLVVVTQTPYYRMVLPATGLSVEIGRDGERVASGRLKRTLDSELGYHYGLGLGSVEAIERGDDLTITPTTPPQVARHEGYETAFVEMPPVTLSIE